MKRSLRPLLLLLLAPLLVGATDGPLTLDEAVSLALRESKVARLAELKTEEASAGLDRARSERYPIVTAFGFAGYTPHPYQVRLSAGSLSPMLDALGGKLGLGAMTGAIGPFPPDDVTLLRGQRDLFLGGLALVQPISQQWRIGSGIAAARAEQSASRLEAARIVAQLRYSVEEIFAGVLVEDDRAGSIRAKLAFQQAQLRDAEHASSVGELLDDAVLGLRAELTQTETVLTQHAQQRNALWLQLADLIGRPGAAPQPLDTHFPRRDDHPLEFWLAEVARNPEREVAAAIVAKAIAGTQAARRTDIPDLALFAAGYSQDGVDLLPTNSAIVGVVLRWDILDFGRRRTETRKSLLQQREAELNRDRLDDEAARQVRLAYQDLGYADELIRLGEQAVSYRQRVAQLARQSVANGLALPTKSLSAEADARQAEADLLAVHLQRHLAQLRLYRLTGRL